MHAPSALQPVAPQGAPSLQTLLQQFPLPEIPHRLLAHAALLVQKAPGGRAHNVPLLAHV
jgi:hypothetical protein